MARLGTVLALVLCLTASTLEAQRRPQRKAPARKQEPAQMTCPELLGSGVKTKTRFCFVLAGRDPAEGVTIDIPPHTGNATLTFDLHNRHTYSEEQVKAGRGFAQYLAVIGVLTMKGDLLGRGAVQSEFRRAADLFDRVSGGAGPGGVKAVAPLGRQEVTVTIPAKVDRVSLLGEFLEATTPAGREIASPGRPVAIVSNPQIEYQPAPVRR